MNVSTRTTTKATLTNCQNTSNIILNNKSGLLSKPSPFMRWFFILLMFVSASSIAQTTLIAPAGNGGFENGATPALNSWTAVNAATDAWVVGAAPTPSAGTACGYISANGGTSFNYSQISTIEHLYTDITIPSGQTILSLTFKWKVGGEGTTTSDWDNMKVFLAPTTVTPVQGTAIAATYQYSGNGAISGMYKLSSASWNTTTILASVTPGTTYRLIFSWKSDISTIANPSAAIDEVSVVTNTASNYTSTATGGLWSSPATWVGGVVPGPGNDITIAAGSIVTVDQVTNYRNVTIDGTVQWNSTTNPMTITGDGLISSTGKLLAYSTSLAGQTINVAGNFTNNGYANLAASSTTLAGFTFNGSGSTLSGTGTFEGNGAGGIIRALFFANLGSNTISTSQNIITNSFGLTAGSLNTGGKLKIDNTAQIYGSALNLQVASLAVTGMGTSYNAAPVVFGASVIQYVSGLAASANSRYVSGNNVYLCIAPGAFNATAPTSTASTTFTSSGPTLLYLGQVGTLGNPFQITAVTQGTQYFYNGNLYTCTVAGTPGVAAVPPTHLSGTAVSGGGATFLYVGTAATATVNYDATTQTVRSLNLTSGGTGYSATAAVTFSVGVAAGTGSGATATAIYFQQIVGTGNSLMQKTTGTVLSGGIDINSDQGASIASADPQASAGIGAISTTNGGINYTIAPTVGFSLPTALNLVVTSGAGYTGAPTITVTGGNLVSGTALATGNFTITMNQGKVVSVYLTGGTGVYSTLPTLTMSSSVGVTATLAFPAGCLPAATAVIGSNGQITDFTISNAGYGYVAAPTIGIGATSGTANGGTFTIIATTPTARLGLYNLTLNYFAPSVAPAQNVDDASIPTNRKINALALNGNGLGIALSSNLTIYGSSTPLTLNASGIAPGNVIDLGGNNLSFTWNTYTGISSTFGATNAYVKNGSISYVTRGGSTSLTYPFAGVFSWVSGTTPTPVTTGSSVTNVTVTETVAPSGAGALGTRAFRVVTNAGSVYGTNPTVTLNYNSIDALTVNAQNLYVGQSAALSGAWAPRSAVSGSGVLPATGSRTTATSVPGPIVPTGDDYFSWMTVSSAFTNVTVPTGVCTPSAHVINADVTSVPGTITGVTITYNNGAAAGPLAMTNSGGNTWTYSIPAASPGNTLVTWSLVATNSFGMTTTFTGTSYQDDPLNGATAVATATPSAICAGSPVVLSVVVSKPGTVVLGAGGTNSTTTAATFLPGGWGGAKTQYIIKAAELTSLGFAVGSAINSMAFETTTVGQTYQGFAVNIGLTGTAVMTTSFISTAMSQVYRGTLANDGFLPVLGVNTLAFGTGAGSVSSFVWDGTSNIFISICWSSVPNAGTSTATSIKVDNVGFVCSAYDQTDNVAPATECATATGDGTGSSRPKFTFGGVFTTTLSAYTWNDGTSNVGTGNPLTVNPTSPTTYTVTADYAPGCSIVAPGVSVTTTSLPASPTGSNSNQCGTGVPSATVATGGQNGYFRWYSAASGGTALQTGPSTTYAGTISTTTTFYVSESAEVDGSGCESARFAVIATVNDPDAVGAIASDYNPCSNTAITLTASNIAGSPVNIYTYNWTASPQVGSGIPVEGTPGASISVTPTVPGTYVYTANAVDGLCATSGNTANVVVKALPVITTATASPAVICDGTPVTLDATTTVSAPATVQIGSGVGSNSSSSTIGAFYGTWYGNGHAQIMIKASEMTAAGFIAGNLTDLKIDVSALASNAADKIVKGFTIKLGTISAATTTITTFQAPVLTPVYGPTDYTPIIGTNTHSFTAPYYWDGTSNIIVDYCFANSVSGGGSAINTITTTGFGSFVNYQVDNVNPPCAITTVSNASANRPNIKITGLGGSTGAGTFTWTWNPGGLDGATQSVTPSTTTTYTVSAYDPATTCTNTQDVEVTVNPIPAQPTANTGDDLCGTNLPTISLVSNSGAGAPVFHWYSAETGGTLLQNSTSNTYTTTIDATTTFYVTEVSAAGCESTPRVAVTQYVNTPDAVEAQANATATSLSICAGSSFDLSAVQSGGNGNTYVFTWTATGGANSGITDPLVGTTQTGITPLAVGSYTYTVVAYDDQTLCTTNSSVTVTVNPTPTGATANASFASVCTGATVDLTGGSLVVPPVFTEGFETYPPSGWTFINAGSGNAWRAASTITPLTTHTGADAMGYLYNSTFNANAWGITPAYTLTSGVTYTLKFWYNTGSVGGAFPENLKVTVGAGNAVVNQTTTLLNYPGLINETWQEATVTYTPVTTGSYNFGFNCYSDADNNVLFIDDVSLIPPTPEVPTYSWYSIPSGFTSNVQNPTNVVVNENTTYAVQVSNSFGCSDTAFVAVAVIPLPAAPTPTNSTQCGLGIPTASVTSGGGGGGFNWYSASTAGTLLQAGGTTYGTAISATTTFYVSEGDGTCQSLRTPVTVTVTNPPAFVITPSSAAICAGFSVSLDAVINSDASYVNFSWTPSSGLDNPGSGVVSANPSATTTYTVTADDGIPVTGCTASATITVTVNANPVIDSTRANPPVICLNGASTLTAYSPLLTTGPQTAPTGYLSSNASSTSDEDILNVTLGTLNNTSTCSTTGGPGSILNEYSDFSAVPAPTLATGTTVPISIGVGTCGGNYGNWTNVYIDYNRDGLFDISERAYTSTASTSGAHIENGNIVIPVNAAAGVTKMRVYVVEGGTANSSPTGTYSWGETEDYLVNIVSLSTVNPNYSYTWNTSPEQTGVGLTSISVSPTAPTTAYNVIVKNTLTNCSTTGTVSVDVLPVGAAPTASPSTTVCAGTAVTLSAGASGGTPYFYSWSTGASTPTITVTPSTTTTYTVIVTDGCNNSTAATPIEITVNPLPTVTIAEAGPITFCQPATQVLTANTAAVSPTYQWTLNAANIPLATLATYTVTQTGSYAVKVTDGNSCVSLPSTPVSVTVNAQPSEMTISPISATICAGDTATLTASGGTIGGTYTLGTGITTTSGSGITPYTSLWEASRIQYLVRASELTALGMVAGEIKSLAFDVTIAGPGTVPQSGFAIKMAHTLDMAFAGSYATPTGSFTTVYGPVSQGAPSVGLNTYTFTSSFVWDGSSNVLIDICHDNDIDATCPSCYSSSSTVKYTATGFNSNYGRYNDNAAACGVIPSSGSTTYTNRPNMVFNSSVPTTITWNNPESLNTATGSVVKAFPLTTTTYTATSTSIAGCPRTADVEVTVNDCPSVLSLTAFLEGFYRGGSTMAATNYDLGLSMDPTETDNIEVNLWSPSNLSNPTPDFTTTAVLHTDGTATVTIPSGAGGKPYYIAVKHRNSIETWSKLPVAFKPAVTYNFSTGLNKAYDDGINPSMASVGGGVYALYGGDVNQDGTVDASDMSTIDNDKLDFAYGYNASDTNGDGSTDASDIALVDNNTILFLFFARPY